VRIFLILQKNESEWIALGSVSDMHRMIVEACFGTEVRSHHEDGQTLASHIVSKVTHGLFAGIHAAIKVGDQHDEWTQIVAELPANAWDVASGAAYVSIHCGQSTIELVLSPLLVSRIVDMGSPNATDTGEYEPVSRAIESECMTLEIAAGVSDISLSDLRTLAVGDVIKLSRQVNKPLSMFMGTKQVGQALLGSKDDRMAIRVLSFQ